MVVGLDFCVEELAEAVCVHHCMNGAERHSVIKVLFVSPKYGKDFGVPPRPASNYVRLWRRTSE